MTTLMTTEQQERLVKYLSKNYPGSKRADVYSWATRALEDTDVLAGSYSQEEMLAGIRAKKAEQQNTKLISEIKRLKTKVNVLMKENAALKGKLRIAK